MKTASTIIKHKPGKVESELITDDHGNLIEGKTYKYYAPYLKKLETATPDKRERLSRFISLCFEHEKNMLELVKSKGLPGVKLVREHPGLILEMEYVAGKTLADHLASGVTPIEARWLITETLNCIACHTDGGIVLNDTNLSNFLVLPTWRILFCDYGNASSDEQPFISPPLASGNRKGLNYFSPEQDKAFKADHAMHHKHGDAPYPPESLKSNELTCKGDYYVLAKHLLDLSPSVFDNGLREILERMKLGKYHSADAIIKDLAATAPPGFNTPEIDLFEESTEAPAHSRRHKQWSWIPSWEMPHWTVATAAVICLAIGIGVVGMQSGFVRSITDFNRLPILPVQQPATAQPTEGAGTDVQAKATSSQAKEQGKLVHPLEAISKPVAAILAPTHQKQLNTAKPALKPSNTAKSTDNDLLEKARSAAFSTDTTVALRGINSLHKLTKLKSPAASQASEAFGKLIEQLENAVPSESGKRRLDLLCSHGHVRAHFVIARWLEVGKGLKGGRDLASAYRHYVKASIKVDKAAEAVVRLEKLAQGIVRNPPDRGELFQLLVTIADRPQNRQAQAAVGLIYAEGRYGQIRDMASAEKYLRRSVKNGFAEARDIMRNHGIKE